MRCHLLVAFGNKSKSDRARAHSSVKKLLLLKPDFHRAALLNIEMGQVVFSSVLSRAKQKFVHALQIQPKLPEAHSAIGYFHETVGDIEEAEKYHKQAVAYGAGKGRYFNNYGTFSM